MSRTRSKDAAIEISTVPPGDASEPYELHPGVKGIAVWHDDDIWISYIDAEKRGVGAVSRFLDKCPDNVVFSTVINTTFAAMLERRGWFARMEYITEKDTMTDVWRKGL